MAELNFFNLEGLVEKLNNSNGFDDEAYFDLSKTSTKFGPRPESDMLFRASRLINYGGSYDLFFNSPNKGLLWTFDEENCEKIAELTYGAGYSGGKRGLGNPFEALVLDIKKPIVIGKCKSVPKGRIKIYVEPEYKGPSMKPSRGYTSRQDERLTTFLWTPTGYEPADFSQALPTEWFLNKGLQYKVTA